MLDSDVSGELPCRTPRLDHVLYLSTGKFHQRVTSLHVPVDPEAECEPAVPLHIDNKITWIWRKSVQPFPSYLIHKQKKQKKTRAKDVLPNTSRTQAAEITPMQRRNGPVCCCMTLFAANALQCVMQQNGPFVRCRGVMGHKQHVQLNTVAAFEYC